jgi:hypothetical protein
VDWIDLAQDSDKWRIIVNALMNLGEYVWASQEGLWSLS